MKATVTIVQLPFLGAVVLAAACGYSQPSRVASDGPTGDSAGPVDAPAQFSSCTGLAHTCGANANDNCCAAATTIPGGTFYRSYDAATDNAYPDMSFPATVSTFRLDKYEVTVGRFRAFVNAGYGTRSTPPAAGTGSHPSLANSGWDAAWNASLTADASSLIGAVKCDATFQTWTDTAGANETKPMNCITWYEAMAFCIWDGGYLPTEAEWNYAAAGGSEQRAYPWSPSSSSTTIDCSHANYKIDSPSGTYCVNSTTGAVNRVGSESPNGDGKWGQTDLGGNVWEWNLDWSATYPTPCNDCANLAAASNRVIRGGSFDIIALALRAGYRSYYAGPAGRSGSLGVRCARTP